MSAANLTRLQLVLQSRQFHGINIPYSHFSSPQYLLVASASIMVNLLLQLMKATVMAENSRFLYILLDSVCSAAVCRHESDRCHSFFAFLPIFCVFTFPCFPIMVRIQKGILPNQCMESRVCLCAKETFLYPLENI